MTLRKKRFASSRRVLITKTFSSRFSDYLDYYAALTKSYPKVLLKKLREILLPQLQNFPESGREIEDIAVLRAFAQSRIVKNELEQIENSAARLSLREIILDKNFKILYGYDKKHVVLLAIKHMAKKAYGF